MGYKLRAIWLQKKRFIKIWNAYVRSEWIRLIFKDAWTVKVAVQHALEDKAQEIGVFGVHRVKYLYGKKVTIYTSRPGILVGRAGENLLHIQKFVRSYTGLEHVVMDVKHYNPFDFKRPY